MADDVLPFELANEWLGNGLLHAVLAAFLIIIVTELFDKTFFIAAVMSMQHSRVRVFAGAISALVFMTVLSSLLGVAAKNIPREITHYAASILFVLFGLKMLYDAWKLKPEKAKAEYEETVTLLREQQEELERTFGRYSSNTDVRNSDVSKPSVTTVETNAVAPAEPAVDAESQTRKTFDATHANNVDAANSRASSPPPSAKQAKLSWQLRVLKSCPPFCSLIFLQALMLTFLAEWGDRSQLSTIVLVARGQGGNFYENFWGVILGACAGHTICTGLACVGGSYIGKKVSPRIVTAIGGVIFLAFAVYGFVAGV